ncbi:MAG: efflux RND transporter periplasmic adaptor subunit, partial [Pseudomonadota bacterium]
DDARAASRAAEAQLKSARAGSAALAEVANQGKILAPADGRVVRAPVPQGAVVMPGEMVAEIATGRRVLRAELPEADGAGLREGDEISIVRAGEAAAITAKILQVYPAVQDGKIVIDIDATGLDGGFVGMRVPALVPVGTRPSIAIPGRYVLVRFGVDYVRLAREDGSVIDAPVQRGREIMLNGQRLIEILAGLRAGDLILPAEPESGEDEAGVLAREAT